MRGPTSARSASPASTTRHKAFLPFTYKPPWDDSLPNWDGVYLVGERRERMKLWRQTRDEKDHDRLFASLSPDALLRLLIKHEKSVRFMRLRAQKALLVEERAKAHSTELHEKEDNLVESARMEFGRTDVARPTHVELDVLLRLDQVAVAATECAFAMDHHIGLLSLCIEQCTGCCEVLLSHISSIDAAIRTRKRSPTQSSHVQKTALNDINYFAIHRDAQLAAELENRTGQECRRAMEVANTHSTKLAQAAIRVTTTMHEISSSPARLSIKARFRAWKTGLDNVISGIALGSTCINTETPKVLLNGRYPFDSPFNHQSLALQDERIESEYTNEVEPGRPYCKSPIDAAKGCLPTRHEQEGDRNMAQVEREPSVTLAGDGTFTEIN